MAALKPSNADNEMTGFDGSTLGYDTDGQLTSDPVDTYTWDTRRHLSAVSGVDGASLGTPSGKFLQYNPNHYPSISQCGDCNKTFK